MKSIKKLEEEPEYKLINESINLYDSLHYISRELDDLAKAFEQTGNNKISDKLHKQSEKVKGYNERWNIAFSEALRLFLRSKEGLQ